MAHDQQAIESLVAELEYISSLDLEAEDVPLTAPERAAYTEALRYALSLLRDPMRHPDESGEREQAPAGEAAPKPPPCPSCGGMQIDALGGAICPRCED